MKFIKNAIFAAVLALCTASYSNPQKVIFDTDMGNDVDDALALAMLYGYHKSGKAELAGILVNKGNPNAPKFCAALNKYYGLPDIPIGFISNGKTPEDGAFNAKVLSEKNADGTPKYPFEMPGGGFPDSVKLARKILAESEDKSVVYISVGFLTNIARLLESAPDEISPLDGKSLAAKKIKYFSVMGGDFKNPGSPEYNIQCDIKSAQIFAATTPCDAVFGGFEIGCALKFPQREMEARMSPNNPINAAYKLYAKMLNRGKSDRHDRPSWDLASVLYVFEPELFDVSDRVAVSIDNKGRSTYAPDKSGKCRFLKIPRGGGEKILKKLVEDAAYEPGN